ncbi:PPC domain-containing DNA-binding protein [Microbacterium excoecariae]|uniref:PPC domain-containing DNA-binding protein n=1 Tax=Microbacterium excoecariae TaxID=2715210 RepID=UPI001407563B|nr:DUF296 domain-containing protein [Microbacterium excoecariae]NHI16560.1 DUF296 domain-containing protein [Microbacterium excoecariae]
MHSAELIAGRRFLLVLEPGEDLLAEITAFCAREGIGSALIPVLFGAFRSVRLIGAEGPPADPELPLPESIEVAYVEGTAQGSVARGPEGDVRVHVHAAVGRKDQGALAYAGHVLDARVHYTTEVLVEEVLEPPFRSVPVQASFGIPCLRFG